MRLPPSPFLASLCHAWDGWNSALSTQRNLRIHVHIALALCVVCVPLGLEALETALLLTLVGLVFFAELINTALEAGVDLGSPGPHPLAKLAKDAAAAAVLVLALAAVAVFFVLFARQWPLLRSHWQQHGPAWALLGCSWLMAWVEWTWFRQRPIALVYRAIALCLWLGGWVYALSLSFWALGLFLLLFSGVKKRVPPSPLSNGG